MIYIFLDDERHVDTNKLHEQGYEWIVCRDAIMAMTALHQFQDKEIIIDLDHDLGSGMTGYDVCKYIVANNIPLVGFKIHSMNPVGAFNMRQLLTHYGYQEI